MSRQDPATHLSPMPSFRGFSGCDIGPDNIRGTLENSCVDGMTLWLLSSIYQMEQTSILQILLWMVEHDAVEAVDTEGLTFYMLKSESTHGRLVADCS